MTTTATVANATVAKATAVKAEDKKHVKRVWILCKNGEKCQFGKECVFVHPGLNTHSVCYYGEKCDALKNPTVECKYLHVVDGNCVKTAVQEGKAQGGKTATQATKATPKEDPEIEKLRLQVRLAELEAQKAKHLAELEAQKAKRR